MDNENNKIPKYVIEKLARMILPEIQKFYESDKGKAFNDLITQQENNEYKQDQLVLDYFYKY